MEIVALWIMACLFFATCWMAYKTGQWLSTPRQKPQPKKEEPQALPLPTRTEIRKRLREEFAENLEIIASAPVDDDVKLVGRDQMTQKFIRDVERLL